MGEREKTETLQEQVQALKELIEVSKAVVSSLDLDAVLQTILASAMRFAGTPAGIVALYDELRRSFTLHASTGLSPCLLEMTQWDLAPGSLTEHVVNSRSLVFVEDLGASPFP